MDAANIIGIILEKGLLGALLLLALWDRQKMQQRVFDEHTRRLEDKDKSTQALLAQNDRLHVSLEKMSDLVEAIGKRTPL